MAKWYEDKSLSRLDLVHEHAKSKTGKQAICDTCKFFRRPASGNVGSCAQRPREPQFQYGVCLSWEGRVKP